MREGGGAIAETARQEDAFDRFRAAVLAEPRWQAALAGAADWDSFIARGVEAAAALGVALTAEALALRRRQDPLSLHRFDPPPAVAPSHPQPGWRPARVVWDGQGHGVDWAYFGDQRLVEPFYEGALRKALATPFNTLFRFRTPLSELGRWSRERRMVRPAGLIFHMSRCGSTLVAQMLAASSANLVISEAAPIDQALQIGGEAQAALLGEMVGALAHAATGEAQRSVLKLEPWHIFALPAFRTAFPDAPWLFLYREPAEVMVSQMRDRTAQIAPPRILHDLCGDEPAGMLGEAECARVLGAVCQAALDALAAGGGLLLNYAQLPQAFWTRIAPHFGLNCSEAERIAMARVARFGAKSPDHPFAPDSRAKHGDADENVRAVCAAHLDPPYRRLEAARLRQEAATS